MIACYDNLAYITLKTSVVVCGSTRIHIQCVSIVHTYYLEQQGFRDFQDVLYMYMYDVVQGNLQNVAY